MLFYTRDSSAGVFLTPKDIDNIRAAAKVYIESRGVAGFKDDNDMAWGDYIDACSGVWDHTIARKDCRRHSPPPDGLEPKMGTWYENNGRYNFDRERELRSVMYAYIDNITKEPDYVCCS